MSRRQARRPKSKSSGAHRKRRPRPEPGKQAATGAFTLRTFDVGAMPLVDHILERMGLEELLQKHLPPDDPRTELPTAQAILVMVRNVLMSREPIYGVGEWAARFAPDQIGLWEWEVPLLSDDRLGRRGVVIADIVDGTGPRLANRGDQHPRQILDMDARKDVTRLVDAFCRAGTQRIERAAAGAVNPGEAEDVDRHAAVAPQLEPTLFCGDAPAAALAGRQQLSGLVNPAAAAIAIDPGRRQIAEPAQPRHRSNVIAVSVEHRVADRIGGHRDEKMGDPAQ